MSSISKPSSSSASRVPFHDLAQIEILDAPHRRGRARIPDNDNLHNHFGTVHGGMLFAVGEVAAASAMMRLLGPDIARVRAIKRSARIDYLKPARGAIAGEGRVEMTREEILLALELQPSVSVPVAVELTDADGVIVAKLAVDWFVGRPRSDGPKN